MIESDQVLHIISGSIRSSKNIITNESDILIIVQRQNSNHLQQLIYFSILKVFLVYLKIRSLICQLLTSKQSRISCSSVSHGRPDTTRSLVRGGPISVTKQTSTLDYRIPALIYFFICSLHVYSHFQIYFLFAFHLTDGLSN